MAIGLAKVEDIEDIIRLKTSMLIRNIDSDEAKREGFLVYPISKTQLKEVLADESNIVLCARDGDGVTGYILAYDVANWTKHKPEWEKKSRCQKT